MTYRLMAIAAAALASAMAGEAQATTFVQYNLSGMMSGTRAVQPMDGPGYMENVSGRVTFTYNLPVAPTSTMSFAGYFLGSTSQLSLTPLTFSFSDAGSTNVGTRGVIAASACLFGAVASDCGSARIIDGGRNYALNLNGSIDSLSSTIRDASSVSFGLIGYSFATTAVPEPGTWTMMMLGFGLLGAAMRRRPAAFVPA